MQFKFSAGATLLCLLAAVSCSSLAADAPAPPSAEPFELKATQRVPLPGTTGDSRPITFGVIPTQPLGAKTYYNPISRMVEQRITPPINHPIPVLRARNIRLYPERPEFKALGMDTVATFENEVTITPTAKYALVGTDNGVILLSLSDIQIPEDRPDNWRMKIRAEQTAKLVEHVPDAVGDRGRAVISSEPLPLAGRLVFGTQEVKWQGPTVMKSLDLSAKAQPAKATEIAKAENCRMAPNGTLLDRVDLHTLQLTDSAGKKIGEVKIESEIAEFNIAPDAKRVVVSTERMVESKNELPHREIASLVFSADGKLVTEIVGYDDCTFMPNGNLVVTGHGGQPGLFIAELPSGKVTPIKLLDGPGGAGGAAGPDWPIRPAVSPDGKWIVYQSRRDIFVVGVDGRGWTPVWFNPDHAPQTQPIFSPDGRYIAFVNVPLNVMSGPGEVYIVDLQKHVRQPLPESKGASSEVPMTWQP